MWQSFFLFWVLSMYALVDRISCRYYCIYNNQIDNKIKNNILYWNCLF